jgi:hypothetical protein
LDTRQGEELTANWDKFGTLDPQHILKKLQETDQYRAIAAGLEHFPTVDQNLLVDKLFETYQAGAITEYLTGFSAIERKELFDRLLASGSASEIGKQMQLGRMSDEDKRAYAFFLLDKDDDISYQRINSSSKFFQGLGLEQVIADKLLNAGHLSYLPHKWEDKYSFSSEQLRSLESRYLELSADEFSKYVRLVADLPAADRPRATGEAISVLGSRVTRDNARVFQDILSGTIDEDTRVNLGIHQIGEAGIAELKQSLSTFVSECRAITLSDETLDKLEKSDILLEVFKGITRYEVSSWGAHDNGTLVNTLRYYRTALRQGRIEPMPIEYQPSRVLEVAKLSAQKEKSRWTEDLLLRYGTLRTELQDVGIALGEPRPFSRYFNDLRGQIEQMIGNMHARLFEGDLNPKAQESIENRVQELTALITPVKEGKPESYPLRSLVTFEQNFHSLARHTELHPAMRKLVFAWALRQYPEWKQRIAVLSGEPSVDDINATVEFIEHIVNQETFHDYFVDNKNARLFSGMTSVKALEEGLIRHTQRVGVLQDITLSGMTSVDTVEKDLIHTQQVEVSQDITQVQFVPTRGVMMELSGHIADACWANKYSSIAEAMPNMTAVIMKQNPGDNEHEKLIGAGMLIETTSNSGEPILLIRGLNPIQNFINHVSVEEFYEQFLSYARGIAESSGRKLAIVIDNKSGEAGTNRPVLFGFLSDKKRSLQQVQVNEQDTTFNEYNITNDTYLV